MHMHWTFHPVATLGLLVICGLYACGVRAMSATPVGVKIRYAGGFVLGLLFLGTAVLSPLANLKNEYLFARSLQQVFAGILAPPLLWYGRTPEYVWSGVPLATRQWLHRGMQRLGPLPRLLTWITSPGLTWLVTLGVFGLWHDSTVVDRIMPISWLANAFLWLYFLVFVLFWWHALAATPRIHTPLPIWARLVYLIVGGEIANMVTGISLAFRAEPLFAYYALQPHANGLSALQDQMVSGGIIWVTGSFVYVFIAMALLGQVVFRNRPPPAVPSRDWQTATLDTIAPGLEQRLPKRESPD